MCTLLLPPGVNPIAVNKIYQYILDTKPQGREWEKKRERIAGVVFVVLMDSLAIASSYCSRITAKKGIPL
jgi:hypothetical protein